MSSHFVLSVPGMKCGGCVATIENALKEQASVERVECDLELKTVQVDANAAISEVISAIKTAGYDAEPVE